MILETALFLKNFIPYLLIYLFIFFSIIFTITFFLSAKLAVLDNKNFKSRKKEVEYEITTITQIKELVKEEEISSWLKEKYQKGLDRLKELDYLKEISPIRKEEYIKKGIVSLFFVFISLFCYSQLYQYDINRHLPSVYFEQYDEISDKDIPEVKIKFEDFISFKQVTVFDKEQSLEYFYIVQKGNDSIDSIYSSQSIVLPELLHYIFGVCYFFLMITLRYIYRILH